MLGLKSVETFYRARFTKPMLGAWGHKLVDTRSKYIDVTVSRQPAVFLEKMGFLRRSFPVRETTISVSNVNTPRLPSGAWPASYASVTFYSLLGIIPLPFPVKARFDEREYRLVNREDVISTTSRRSIALNAVLQGLRG